MKKKNKRNSKQKIQMLQYRFSKNITPEKLEEIKEKIDLLLADEAIPESDFIGQGRCSGVSSAVSAASTVGSSCDCAS